MLKLTKEELEYLIGKLVEELHTIDTNIKYTQSREAEWNKAYENSHIYDSRGDYFRYKIEELKKEYFKLDILKNRLRRELKRVRK